MIPKGILNKAVTLYEPNIIPIIPALILIALNTEKIQKGMYKGKQKNRVAIQWEHVLT